MLFTSLGIGQQYLYFLNTNTNYHYKLKHSQQIIHKLAGKNITLLMDQRRLIPALHRDKYLPKVTAALTYIYIYFFFSMCILLNHFSLPEWRTKYIIIKVMLLD